MEVNQAFCVRSESGKREGEIWGNSSVEKMLKEFPGLKKLVGQLRSEHNWSEPTVNRSPWLGLFFVDYLASGKKKVSLEIKSPLRSLVCPVIHLDPKRPPNLRGVERFVLKNLRRN